MFNIFKNDKKNQPADVKAARAAILKGIKLELQKAEGGEGKNIKGIDLFIATPDSEKHVYEAAVYADEPGRLKNEVQKIADDYALDLPANWTLDISHLAELPTEAISVTGADAGLFIRTKDNMIKKSATAFIRILSGEAEKKIYRLESTDGKTNIGRDKSVQTTDGFFRFNQIAFPGEVDNEINKYISRQHAHIEWNNEAGSFMLYADMGGVPPGNKVKVRAGATEALNKLISTQIGHRLEEGDQVILGDGAVIDFTYKEPKYKIE
ncbi:FHA domain-containing protein [Mucilaginibacter frigoritolerans]|uniref:FHA domain-containing protein n=1 Tax=Mucilaginibacter frigoritolerans TaxID=652788 RepID=A0A562TNP8_9SPHI|nr:FHA domain-containing protein [Mucilaginibacter frigoritolerans]TWI95033.1 FHA domain-containing protein [Mucilaginibacter frigoritolerans]